MLKTSFVAAVLESSAKPSLTPWTCSKNVCKWVALSRLGQPLDRWEMLELTDFPEYGFASRQSRASYPEGSDDSLVVPVVFGLGPPGELLGAEHWSCLIMGIAAWIKWVSFMILSNIAVLCVLMHRHQVGFLRARDELGRQRGFDLLYFSSCSLVFVI